MKPLQPGIAHALLKSQSRVFAGLSPLPFKHFQRGNSNDVLKTDDKFGEIDDAKNTGVIPKTNKETLFYFTSVNTNHLDLFNFKWFAFLKSFLPRMTESQLKERIRGLASPKSNPIDGLEVTSVIEKDGGAFATFKIPELSNITETNKEIQKNTKAHKPFLFVIKPAAFPVKGTPWVEDLSRYPSLELKVSFNGPVLTEEELYLMFRRYGPIVDIKQQPIDSKELPKYSLIKFGSIKSAISAKNCLNALKISDTIIHTRYNRIFRPSVIKEILFTHTRISIPLILAVLIGLASVIFDPIRELSIEEKISQRFKWSTYKNNKFILWASDYFSKVKSFLGSYNSITNNIDHMWSERTERVKQIQTWLTENIDTFIVVRGPVGIGKQEVVMQYAVKDRDNVLYINCETLVKSRNDSEFLKSSAHQFGYFPIFPWVNSFSRFLDLGMQGLTGQKSGFSENSETQFKNILSLSITAIRRIALKFYKSYNAELAATSGESMTKIVSENDFLQQFPEKKPVIVINKFATKSENFSFIYKAIASWAAILVSMNIAHVIFLVDDVGPMPILSDALPDQVFKVLTLSDASKSAAKEYVINHLQEYNDFTGSDKNNEKKVLYDEAAIESSLEPIGGRISDLQLFVRRLRSGESPHDAQIEMTKQAAEQIIQMNLINGNREAPDEFQCARAWELIKMLGTSGSVDFRQIQSSMLFKASAQEYLLDLERTNLISMYKEKGLVKSITAARQLYLSAFENIINDPKSFKTLETSYLLSKIKFETNVIRSCEDEISKMSYVASSEAMKVRFEYLTRKITKCTNNIIGYEASIAELAKLDDSKKKSSLFSLF